MGTNSDNPLEGLRLAIYARYSSEMQNEMTLESQERVCRQKVATNGGRIVAVYTDTAKTGWSLERPGFMDMCRDAECGKFDAVIMWKFDRLARDPNQSVMIKMLCATIITSNYSV